MEHLTESELRAKAKLKNYINHLEGTKRTQFKSSLKDLRIKGDSWEFITEMLFFKPLDVWDKYGYGLLFNKGYRSQVWNLMNAAFEEDEELDSLFEEEPEPQEKQEEETNDDKLISDEQLVADSPQSGLPVCEASWNSPRSGLPARKASWKAAKEPLVAANSQSELPACEASWKAPKFYNSKGKAYTFNEIAEVLSECPTPKETFKLIWGRHPESQDAICYYEAELSSLIPGGF